MGNRSFGIRVFIDPCSMNILFLHATRGWGGGEVWLTQIVDALFSHGHAVTVACRPQSAFHHTYQSGHADLVPVQFGGDFNPLTIGTVYRLIKKRNIDLVCVHTDKELRVGGLASMLANVPVVVSREVDFPIKDTLVNRFFYRDVASTIMVNSFATQNTLLISAPWLQDTSINVVWKGVDAAHFLSTTTAHLREQFHLDESDVLAGFVGRLDEQKAISTLLEAMSLVVQRDRRVKLVLAGEGNLFGAIGEFCRTRGLEDSIYLAGFREDIPDFLRAIDFLVMPSCWEGFGYAVVEAMTAGKPVVASQVSSLPEIVGDYRTGILVPPRSPEQLAEAMLVPVRNPGLRHILGEAGKTKAASTFSLSSMVDKVESLFLEVVRSSAQSLPVRGLNRSLA
jgi:glycosyltransferase involved in cell wall biosynthesis